MEVYGTSDYQYWGRSFSPDEDSEDSSDDDGPVCSSLEAAVLAYPDAALHALAAHLGLDYFKIKDSMARQKQPASANLTKRAGKRSAENGTDKSGAKIPRAGSARETINSAANPSPPSRRLPIIQPESPTPPRSYLNSSQGLKFSWDPEIPRRRSLSSFQSYRL